VMPCLAKRRRLQPEAPLHKGDFGCAARRQRNPTVDRSAGRHLWMSHTYPQADPSGPNIT
jgi:hypothetical protein